MESKVLVVTGQSDNIAVSMDDIDNIKMTLVTKTPGRKRRTKVPEKPNYPLNLWSIMKNCIGKDLSKIPMPVNFNEPLSMLQRLTEDYEYADLLDLAAQCDDPCEQLAYVAAFTISSYSTSSNRTGKPFNPLLGETYECDRMEDLGWRCIAEQVGLTLSLSDTRNEFDRRIVFHAGITSSTNGSHSLRRSWMVMLAGVHNDNQIPREISSSYSIGHCVRGIQKKWKSIRLAKGMLISREPDILGSVN